MNKRELAKDIVTELWNNEVLREEDFSDHDSMMEDCTNWVMKKLEDYIIVQGQIIE